MKKIILTILILTFAVCLNAQQVTHKWAESTGGLFNFKCYIEVDKKEVYECSKEQWFKIKIKDKVNLKEFVKVNKKKPEKQKIKIEMYGQGQGYGQNSGQVDHSLDTVEIKAEYEKILAKYIEVTKQLDLLNQERIKLEGILEYLKYKYQNEIKKD